MGVINYTTAKINELLAKIEKAPEAIENGKTPVFETGTTTTLDPGLSATAEVVQDGVDDNGNPKYKINFGVPKGLDGASGGGGGVADSVQWDNVINKPSWVNSATKPTYTASEVGALPADTIIPSKTSQLTNDSKFLKSTDFKTINGQSIVGEGNIQIEGGSSGGTGNVNVTNASVLRSNRFYSFQPSKDGSLVGTFQEIPNASESAKGLMSSENYSKLLSIKACIYLPIAFEQVNSSTSKEELVQLFSKAFKQEDLNFAQLVLILVTLSALSDSDGNGDSGAKFFVGNNDCLFRGLYTEAENKLLTEFTYIAIGGKLKTISILFSNLGASDPSEVELSISIIQSDDSYYYLSSKVYTLSVLSTKEAITEAFGGESGLASLKEAMQANKKIFVKMATSSGLTSLLPVSYTIFLNSLWALSFTVPEWGVTGSSFIAKNIKSYEVVEIYNEGYRLSSNFYSLTSSSSSDDISNAVGGESGLKKLIALIKCGNRILIGSSSSFNQVTQLLPNVIQEEENGNLRVLFFGMGYVLWGSLGGSCALSYEKSTNTFKVEITPLFAGS